MIRSLENAIGANTPTPLQHRLLKGFYIKKYAEELSTGKTTEAFLKRYKERLETSNERNKASVLDQIKLDAIIDFLQKLQPNS